MHLDLVITKDIEVLPPTRELAQAAGRGVSNVVKAHLVQRDGRGRSDGLPRTGYWGDAAGGVTTDMDGNIAVVTIPKEGVALHYYGGIVYPTDGHKALAIPQMAATAGKRPAEFDPSREKLSLVWPKGKTTGTLRDKESGEVYYLLVPKATIRADETVLPAVSAMEAAGMEAMEAIL